MAGQVKEYDYLVLGGGSGGVASARRAAEFGIKVACIESKKLGGTCVNVGCVPKKIMFHAASLAESLHDMKSYGFTIDGTPQFTWNTIKTSRDAYIQRLNGIYENLLKKSGVEYVQGWGTFTDDGCVDVDGQKYRGKHTMIAVGGKPTVPDIPGAEFGITSDGFFELSDLPKKTAVVGAGYIAVELAGIMSELGSDVSLFIRHDKALRNFDEMISDNVTDSMEKSGITIVRQSTSKKLEVATDGSLTYETTAGTFSGFNCVIWAIGREPLTKSIKLENIGVNVDKKGNIVVDEFQNTSAQNVYALGDVCGKALLTPVAIAAGRRLAHRLFDNKPDLKLDYEDIPTVVFSHPLLALLD
ncbi:putative glutathione reductase, mitochondrial-like [Apostichopus japonicus]|uniref:Putative glutathione reductase, mitochondrial-like n=1 Tax=Stichopus japonicus TaxID=307972 RepID=A0A2G8KEZ0_STIJA|nr:putative glutathione reductase, mitochondrial-like [Apostichopus japonicus]